MRVSGNALYANAHQRAHAMERTLSYQADRVTWPPGVSQPQALAAMVLAQWTHEGDSYSQRDGAMNGPHKERRLSPAEAEFGSVEDEHPASQQQEHQVLHIVPFLQETGCLLSGKLIS